KRKPRPSASRAKLPCILPATSPNSPPPKLAWSSEAGTIPPSCTVTNASLTARKPTPPLSPRYATSSGRSKKPATSVEPNGGQIPLLTSGHFPSLPARKNDASSSEWNRPERIFHLGDSTLRQHPSPGVHEGIGRTRAAFPALRSLWMESG